MEKMVQLASEFFWCKPTESSPGSFKRDLAVIIIPFDAAMRGIGTDSDLEQLQWLRSSCLSFLKFKFAGETGQLSLGQRSTMGTISGAEARSQGQKMLWEAHL